MRLILRTLCVLVLMVIMTQPAPAQAAAESVTMAHYAFSPATMSVHVGDAVTWTNTDVAPHDVTTTSGPVAVHSSTLSTGQSWTYTFTVPGTYHYICSIHPDMRATLIVVAPSTATAAPVTTRSANRPLVAARRVTSGAALPTASSTASSASQHPSAGSIAAVSPAAPASEAAESTPTPALRPLLLIAGLVAAVVVFCLLLIAARPQPDDGTG